jgi:hypothetical protein
MRSKKTKKDKQVKVVRVTKTEFELDNGDIYPLPFELDETPTLKEFNEIYANSRKLVENLIVQSKNKSFTDSPDEKDTNN